MNVLFLIVALVGIVLVFSMIGVMQQINNQLNRLANTLEGMANDMHTQHLEGKWRLK